MCTPWTARNTEVRGVISLGSFCQELKEWSPDSRQERQKAAWVYDYSHGLCTRPRAQERLQKSFRTFQTDWMSSGETFTAPHKMASLRRASAPNKDKDNKRRSHQTIYLTWTNSSKRKTSPLTPKQTKDCFQTVAYLLTWAEPSSTDLMDFLLQEEKKGGGAPDKAKASRHSCLTKSRELDF